MHVELNTYFLTHFTAKLWHFFPKKQNKLVKQHHRIKWSVVSLGQIICDEQEDLH